MSYSSQNEYSVYKNIPTYYSWNDIQKEVDSRMKACWSPLAKQESRVGNNYTENYSSSRNNSIQNKPIHKKCDGTVNYSKNLYCWEGVL